MISRIGNRQSSLIMQWIVICISCFIFAYVKQYKLEEIKKALHSQASDYRTDIYLHNKFWFYILYWGMHVPLQEIIMRWMISGWIYQLLIIHTHLSSMYCIWITLIISSLIFMYWHFQYKNKWVMGITFILSNYRWLDYLLHWSLLTIIISHIFFWCIRCYFDEPITKNDLAWIPMQLKLLKQKISK